jgi:hypothetical protein
MFNSEVRSILAEVIGSWQVIAVTIVIVIFLILINNVTRFRMRRPSQPKVVKVKNEATKKASSKKEEKTDDSELGLEEE